VQLAAVALSRQTVVTKWRHSLQVRLPSAMVCNPLTTGTGLGNTGNTLGTVDSSSGAPSDATPECKAAGQ
jgi:hypothetical protein